MQLLLFRLGGQPYGLEVDSLQEIVEAPALFYIPLAPACYRGAMNFHGQILPVLDLPSYLGVEGGDVRDRRVIVLAEDLCLLAIAVTALQRIVFHDCEAFPPRQAGAEESPFVRFHLDREGEIIYLLDTAALVASLDAHE